MSVSVALCTYNGAAFVREQLDSIAAQSRPPDEVVVCDDCSTDDTLRIVDTWARSAAFTVRVHANAANIGSTKNFEKAISLCQGQVIATADQDDVWLPTKLERTLDSFAGSPGAGLVFTDAEVVDGTLRPLGYRMWKTRRFRSAEQHLVERGKAVDVLVRRNVVTGATMAFRSRFKDLILPIPRNPIHVHDAWIAFLLSATSEVLCLPEPLIYYRQRPDQLIGAHPPTGPSMLLRALADNSWSTNIDAHMATIAWFTELDSRLRLFRTRFGVQDRVFELIQGKIHHLYARARMPKSRLARTQFVLRHLISLDYHRHSIGVWAAAKDLTA